MGGALSMIVVCMNNVYYTIIERYEFHRINSTCSFIALTHIKSDKQ